jgi:hypothetical protein
MSDQLLAFILALAILLFMVAWVPFLDFLQGVIRKYRDTTAVASPRFRASGR